MRELKEDLEYRCGLLRKQFIGEEFSEEGAERMTQTILVFNLMEPFLESVEESLSRIANALGEK